MSTNGVRIYFDLKKLRVGNMYVPYEQDIHYCVFIESQQNNGPEASDSTDLSGKDEGRSKLLARNNVRDSGDRQRIFVRGARVFGNEFRSYTE